MDSSEILTFAVVAAVLGMLAWVGWANRGRRGRTGSAAAGMMAGIDEAFHPTAAEASEIRVVQQELPAPAPLPGDPYAESDGEATDPGSTALSG